MTVVTASEFARNFGRYQDEAQREPVAVTAYNRITGYFMSAHDYDEFQRFKAMMPVALSVDELDDDTIQGIKASRMDKRHAGLDKLMN